MQVIIIKTRQSFSKFPCLLEMVFYRLQYLAATFKMCFLSATFVYYGYFQILPNAGNNKQWNPLHTQRDVMETDATAMQPSMPREAWKTVYFA